MTPKIYITYDMVFDEKPMSIPEYLKVIDRKFLIQFALLLIQSGDKYEQIRDSDTSVPRTCFLQPLRGVGEGSPASSDHLHQEGIARYMHRH